MLDGSHHDQIWALKDQSNGQPLLGCGACLDRQVCGGLHTLNGGADAISCMSMCRCEDQARCDYVCPNAPRRYRLRLTEVSGWELDNIPLASEVPLPDLPDAVALIEGNVVGPRPIRDFDYVAFPLSLGFRHRGAQVRAKKSRELQQSFGAAPSQGWIASGVERDSFVERMWRLPQPKQAFEALKQAGVVFATSPNYSTYADSPRHDNLHAMKRIAWTWFHMVEAGIPTALHINGRTDHDFKRWANFAARQKNLKAVAFEFLTGAEPVEDGRRYVARLIDFVKTSGRSDLLLVIRGGPQWADELRSHFSQVILLDAGPYFKTVKRQRLEVNQHGKLSYIRHTTKTPSEMRALLRHNVNSKMAIYAAKRSPALQGELDLFVDLTPSKTLSPLQVEADHKASQLDLFP
jgi:hypothetical protein